MDFPGIQFLVHLPSEAVLPPSSCARTHAFHGKIQLYCTAVQDSCTVPRHHYECDVIRHVITGAGRQNDKKNLRRKEEERPRTGTFFAPWGCMPVMDGPIFNRLQFGMRFSRQLLLYFPRLSFNNCKKSLALPRNTYSACYCTDI